MQNFETIPHPLTILEQVSDSPEVDEILHDRASHDLGELAVDSVLHRDAAKEYEVMPKEPIVAELQALPEKLHSRIDRALEKSEFIRTPELEKAVADYYVDHNRLALIVKRVIENTISKTEASELAARDDIVDNFAMRSAMDALLNAGQETGDREASLYAANQVIDTVLFRETCVGATTIDESERQQVIDLQDKLRTTAIDEGMAWMTADGDVYWSKQSTPGVVRGKFADPEDSDNLLKTQELFWEDSRFAGQLLFHNTPFMGEVAKSGFKLSSRSHRAEKNGFYDSATGVFEGNGYQAHTNVTHWSEEFMTDEYKRDNKDVGRTDERVRHPATIVVPLAEIIKTAPYARDGQYGELQLKPDVSANVTINDKARIAAEAGFWPNTGENDIMGRSGKDRTFFADYRADHAKEAHDYVLDAGVGMATDQGSLSKIIVLQRDIDAGQKKRFGEGDATYDDQPYYGAGYGYPGTTVLPFDLDTRPSANRHGEKNFPDVEPYKLQEYDISPAYALNQRTANEHHSYREDGLTADEQIVELKTQISKMQRESRESDRYAGRVIVPLRQGVIEFSTEGRGGGTDVDTFARAFNRKVSTDASVIQTNAVSAA